MGPLVQIYGDVILVPSPGKTRISCMWHSELYAVINVAL